MKDIVPHIDVLYNSKWFILTSPHYLAFHNSLFITEIATGQQPQMTRKQLQVCKTCEHEDITESPTVKLRW